MKDLITWWRIVLVRKLFPGHGMGTCGNRWWRTFRLGRLEYTLMVKDLNERDLYSREELMGMLRHIRRHELTTGWNVPEPNIDLPTIILNGSDRWVWPGFLTYEDIVQLAGYNRRRVLSVVYDKGHPAKPSGILSPGQKLLITDGMVVNVADTSAA